MILFLNSLILALRAIRRNVLRSSLTVLGVVIGVSAVITMVNVGKAATLQVQDQISSMGSNLLIVRPGKRSFGGPRMSAPNFREEDMEAILREASAVERLAPNATTSAMAVYGNENLTTMVTGTNNDYLTVGNWELASGRSFSAAEIRGGRPVCIIGNTVRTNLFGQSDPVGAVLRLKNVSCNVIGLLAPKGESMRGDQDSIILVPLRMYWRRLSGNRDIDMIQVSAKSQGLTTVAKNQIEEILRRKRRILPGQEDNFSVRDMQEIADALAGTTKVLTALLSAIAAVSLLVGGIGIMNIMLVSVTERTREIGIRLAIGALERDVMLQFLIESVALSSLGGLIGIILALLGTWAFSAALQAPFVFDPSIALLALLFSWAVGILFGYFPALKAARLDPIEALRHE